MFFLAGTPNVLAASKDLVDDDDDDYSRGISVIFSEKKALGKEEKRKMKETTTLERDKK